jgi:GNAT superfamily N-acetyltransferase
MQQQPSSTILDSLEICCDKTRLDVETIHEFLKRSSWASKRTRETLLRSIENSLCFGAYSSGRQIAFARVVTDGCTFAYLCDVFVDEEYRGLGISKALMSQVMKHPDLQGYRRFTLATKDAHGLYRKFGFQNVEPNLFMEIKHDGV